MAYLTFHVLSANGSGKLVKGNLWLRAGEEAFRKPMGKPAGALAADRAKRTLPDT